MKLRTAQIPRVATYTAFLNKNGLNGKRIGIVRRVGKVNTFKSVPNDITQLFTDSLKAMGQSGATIVDNINLPLFNNNRDANMAGMRQDVDNYFATYPSVQKNFQDMCNSDRTRVFGNANKCIQFFQSMPFKSGNEYKKALGVFKKNKSYVEEMMQQTNSTPY